MIFLVPKTGTEEDLVPRTKLLFPVSPLMSLEEWTIKMADEDSQEDELLALASIYDERIFTRSVDENGGQFNVFLELPKPFQVKVPSRYLTKELQATEDRLSATKAAELTESEGECELISVQYLPPVVLNFRYPERYPSESPPEFALSCKWLTVPQLSKLCKCLDAIWEESGPGEVILFRWIQFLLDETLTELQVGSEFRLHVRRASKPSLSGKPGFDKRAIQDVGSFNQLVNVILEYDQQETRRVFENSYHSCNVCFNEKLGSESIEFHQCKHVYCRECMAGYFEVQIKEGAVKALTCPSDKCESQALPSQVKELVSSDLFAKYDKFLLQSSLDGMSDVVYCPRPTCGTAVMLDKESSMGVCSCCSLAFCAFCKRAYHGVSPCKIATGEFKKLWDEYQLATEEEKRFMEQRYGKRQLKRVFEEMVSEEWLNSNSKQCPTCSSHIQKIDGCNKMKCTKCRCYFCWICMATLTHSNPYLHFNSPSSVCFNKLFEGIDPNDFGDDEDWFA